MKYLKLIGYQDLLMIAVIQILIKYFFFVPFHINFTLNNFGTSLLILGTLSIAAAGKIIIALNNMEADRINGKLLVGKSISEKTAYTLFICLNVLGVGIGFYLSNSVGHPSFSALAILISGLLYMYATNLKRQLIVGNVVIAILSSSVIVVMALYDLLPAITPENRVTQHTIFSILLDYSFLAFLLILLREIVRDQIEMNGDYKTGNKTLPVTLGRMRTNKILFLLVFLPLGSVIYYMYNYLFGNQLIVVYVLISMLAPLLLFMVKILSVETHKKYVRLYWVLSVSIWFSLLSVGLYKYILL